MFGRLIVCIPLHYIVEGNAPHALSLAVSSFFYLALELFSMQLILFYFEFLLNMASFIGIDVLTLI